MGVFKSQFIEHLSFFGDKYPQNGSKNDPMVPRTTLGCPHEGPRVVYLCLRCRTRRGNVNGVEDVYLNVEARVWP
jgi:hypothetical protein